MRLVRLVRSVVTAVVLIATAAGCSAAEEPAPPAPTSSTTATETPESEPSPSIEAFVKPPLPAEATTPDAAGAEAFIRYWYELVNYAYASGDVAVIPPVSHVDCVACQNLVANVRTATDVGAVWQDLTFTPEQFEVSQPDADGITLATALVIASPDATVRQADGTVVDVTGTEVESVRFWAQWTGDHWQTFAIAFPDRQS